MAEKKKGALQMEINIGRVKDIDIMLFTKHLSVALKSGVSLLEALEILAAQAKGKIKNIINSLVQTVRSGESFYYALKQNDKYFSDIYLNMIRSGEVSGTLEENLERLSIELKKSLTLKKKVKSAMLYPSMVFIAIFGLGMSVALFILPKILPLFDTIDTELPITTQWLIYVAELFKAHGIWIVLGSFAVLGGVIWLVTRRFMKPLVDRTVLKIPIVGKIVKNVNLTRFNRTFGTLLDTGLTVDEGLKITARSIGNDTYKKALEDMILKIQSGNTIKYAAANYPKLFPPITVKMISVGERTGNLSSTLIYLSTFYEEEVDDAVKNISTIIEPVMLMIIGVVVGVVALAILGPIYEITGNLG